MKRILVLLVVAVIGLPLVLSSQGCGKNPVGPEVASTEAKEHSGTDPVGQPTPVIEKPIVLPMVVRTTGYQAYATEWQGAWYNPHFALKFYIPHSTYSVQRYIGIPDGGYEGGINNWTSSRTNLGNGTDMYILLVPKRLRLQYLYISDWDFSRYFWLWCTYNA